jgi:hypothetical protein
MMRKTHLVMTLVFLCLTALACNLGDILPLGRDVEEASVVMEAVKSTELSLPTPTDEDPILVEPADEVRKGQIAYIQNGNVWFQNLESGVLQQLTFDADIDKDWLNVYRKPTFSDSGHYLAYEYGYYTEGTLQVVVIDLVSLEEIIRLPGEMLIGWRHDEEVLLVGHSSAICDYHQPATIVPDEDISFMIVVYDVQQNSISDYLTIPEGHRFPSSIQSTQNYMVFQECPCEVPMCYWIREVFTEDGETFDVPMGYKFSFSDNGKHYIPISHSIHEPEADGLLIFATGDQTGEEIYFEEGKFITEAYWSPGDDSIVFWVGDVDRFNFRSKLMRIQPDGSNVSEIQPIPEEVLGWFSDGRLMVLPASTDQISLYDPETGEWETLAKLNLGSGWTELQWHPLP